MAVFSVYPFWNIQLLKRTDEIEWLNDNSQSCLLSYLLKLNLVHFNCTKNVFCENCEYVYDYGNWLGLL